MITLVAVAVIYTQRVEYFVPLLANISVKASALAEATQSINTLDLHVRY
jgi:hypothetical protein